MKIGITYDLRADYLAQGFSEADTAEFDRADTIDAIEDTLRDLGFETERIGNIKTLAAWLVDGSRWDMVFNIAEGLKGFGRESQVPALLEAYDIPYTFSDPLVLGLSLHKAMAKHVLRDKNILVSDFFVVEKAEDTERVELAYPLFAKPVAEGTSKGITQESKINNREELKSVCIRLLEEFDQPVLVETFLPGREFTIGITGTDEDAVSIGVMEVLLKKEAENEIYSYKNKKDYTELVEYKKAEDLLAVKSAKIALSAWRALNCRDGGRVDIRLDSDGNPNVMEINTLPGLNPEHSDLCIIARQAGISYRTLINAIISSAIKRIKSTQPSVIPSLPMAAEK